MEVTGLIVVHGDAINEYEHLLEARAANRYIRLCRRTRLHIDTESAQQDIAHGARGQNLDFATRDDVRTARHDRIAERARPRARTQRVERNRLLRGQWNGDDRQERG